MVQGRFNWQAMLGNSNAPFSSIEASLSILAVFIISSILFADVSVMWHSSFGVESKPARSM